jgi:hypothetical protein
VRVKTLVIGSLAVLLIGALLLPTLQTARWGGRTDIDIQFRVTDAATGQPIPGARIDLAPEERGERFCEDPITEPFTLVADDNGIASRLTTGCPCGGSQGWFEDTFGVNFPGWSYRVTADGYSDSEKLQLRTPENGNSAKRGPPHTTVLIPVALHKQP